MDQITGNKSLLHQIVTSMESSIKSYYYGNFTRSMSVDDKMMN